MRTSVGFHIDKDKAVKISAETGCTVRSSEVPYCILKVQTENGTIDLFCSDEQLDQIAAAIQAAKEARA